MGFGGAGAGADVGKFLGALCALLISRGEGGAGRERLFAFSEPHMPAPLLEI